jgi:hypothetical protein
MPANCVNGILHYRTCELSSVECQPTACVGFTHGECCSLAILYFEPRIYLCKRDSQLSRINLCNPNAILTQSLLTSNTQLPLLTVQLYCQTYHCTIGSDIMKRSVYTLIGMAIVLAGGAIVTGCGGGEGEVAKLPHAQATDITGVKVYVADATSTYVVYGGNATPSLLRGTCFNPDGQVDVAAWMAIGDNPAGHGCTRLGEATGSAVFAGKGYQYYVIKPRGNGPLMVDALELLGPRVYWWGLWDNHTQGAFTANLSEPEKMYGPADGEAATLNLQVQGQAASPSGFILVPAHSWVEGQWSS